MSGEQTLKDLGEKQNKRRHEMRYKILSISPDLILSLLYPIGDCNIISKVKLPEDVHVNSVHYNYERREFDILLESDEFEPVDPGFIPPRVDPVQYVVTKNQIMGIDEIETSNL